MTEFKLNKILVPLDGSTLAEQAIPFAVAIAAGKSTITFIQVLPEAVPLRDLIGRVTATEDETGSVAEARARESLEESVHHWASILPGGGEFVVRTGDPAGEILAAAEELGCDLIVAASRGRGAIGRLAFGSVADRLARASTVPVLLVRPDDAAAEIGLPDLRRVLIPYDGSEHAAEAFPVAAALHAQLGLLAHVVRVVTPTSYTPLAGPMEPFYTPQVLDQLLSEIEAEAKDSINAAVAELATMGVEATAEVMTGTPAATLQACSDPGDVIVMTSHGRSGFTRWLLGSVAEQLVREGPVPVLLVPARARGAEQ